jgi:hypothetical protein
MNGGVGTFFGALTSLLLLALAISGLHREAVLIGVGITLLCVALTFRNRKEIESRPSDRADRSSLAMAGTFVPAPVLASCLFCPPTGDRLWQIRALIISLVVFSASIYLSNLFDWAYTRPRLEGAGTHPRPCAISTEPALRTVTQLLLTQRLTTYTLARLGLAAAAAFLAVATLPHLGSTATSLLATAITLVAGSYLTRIIPTASLATDLPIAIGDTIVLADESGGSPSDWPSYYVALIVFEGVHLIELDGDGSPRRDGPRDGPDRLVDLAEAKRLLRRRNPFAGCAVNCSGANAYCPLERGESV